MESRILKTVFEKKIFLKVFSELNILITFAKSASFLFYT